MKYVINTGVPLSLLLLLLVFAIPQTSNAADNLGYELTIVHNDSLIAVCRKYLKQHEKWREIGRLNHLKNFDLIRSGQKLIIPVALLKGLPVDGRVVFVKGNVTYRERVGGTWKPLKQSDAIRQGSVIKTGHESTVEIAFADGAAFTQRPDTNMELNNSEVTISNHFLQKLVVPIGSVFMKVRRATGRDSRIEIQTPSATTLARGTDFRVSAGSDATTTAEVQHGIVDVSAMHHTVALNKGEGTLVKQGEPPAQPHKLLPPPSLLNPQTSYRKTPLFLELETISGAAAYRYILSRDMQGKDVLSEKTLKPGESIELANLEDGVYYFQTTSIDNLGLEGFSNPPATLTIRTSPLAPFVQTPLVNSNYKGKTVVFQWLKVLDAAKYQMQLSTNREFKNASTRSLDIKGTEYSHDFEQFGEYYFRIRSVAQDGYAGEWSDSILFRLIPPPPSPAVEKPDVKGDELHIRWRNQGDNITYHFQVSPDVSFQTILTDRKEKIPEITLAKPGKAGTYYVRISSIDADGYEGPFSTPQSFDVEQRSYWPTVAGSLGLIGTILLFLL